MLPNMCSKSKIHRKKKKRVIFLLFNAITCASLYGYWPLAMIVISISIEYACLIYMNKERRDGKFILSPQEIINLFRLFYHLSMNNFEILNKQFGNDSFCWISQCERQIKLKKSKMRRQWKSSITNRNERRRKRNVLYFRWY